MIGYPGNMSKTAEHPILFYDGICGLCNRSVQWVLKYDKNEVFRFATLQGKIAEKHLTLAQRQNLNSVVVLDAGTSHEKSAAFFRIVRYLRGWPRIFLLFSWWPRSFSNIIYDWIARNRYRWFGKLDACPMPDPAVRERFLDDY